MTLLRKSGLGPGRRVACQACGNAVMPHPMSVLVAIPAFLGGLYAVKSASVLIGGAAMVAGVVAMALIQTFLVPLVRTDT
jgi:hypothetical protein